MILLLLAAAPAAVYGHGLGSDQAPPISFEGMDVTIRTEITPSDITAGQFEDANIGIRFFDERTDANLRDVTYRVEIYRSQDLLARDLFYDTDGELNVEVRPVPSCSADALWKCTTTYGETHPIAGALFARGEGRPIIEGPIFDKGGLYNIRVDIEGASSPRTLVSQPLSFETFVSVAQDQDFLIRTAEAQEVPVTVKTYYDDVTSLEYSDSDDSITFEMPFDWDPEYISQVQVVHEEVRIPKDFAPYAPGSSFEGYVNGVKVASRALLLDPYSSDDANILHFLVTNSELERINGILGPGNHASGSMEFRLVPTPEAGLESAEFYLVDVQSGERAGSNVSLSWDASAPSPVPVSISFRDDAGSLIRDAKYAYFLMDRDGNTVQSGGDDPADPGIEAVEGIDVQPLPIRPGGPYRLDVWLLGQGLDLDQARAGIGSALLEAGPRAEQLPGWIKVNAGLWGSGQIGDETFVSAIQYLMRENIISVPPGSAPASQAEAIPGWVRSNAQLWADGQIDDATFAAGLQWLVSNGIIDAS